MTHKAIGELRVKPLEWKHIPSLDVWSADGGIYWAWEREGVGYWRRWHPQDNENHQVDGDGEAAEAACQADYEASILSALDRSPTVVGEVGASVYTVYDWTWTDETGAEHYARTPERAVRLQAEGQKLTPVYTRAAVPASPSKPEQAPPPVPQAVAWTCVNFTYDPCGSAKCQNCGRRRAEHPVTVASPLSGGDTGKAKFKRGDRVEKIKGSSWRGLVVGEYSTTLTPEGYCVESENEPGSVQLYPVAALRPFAGGDTGKEEGGIRICPERDGPCPHGMSCPYTGDRWRCDIDASRAALRTLEGKRT